MIVGRRSRRQERARILLETGEQLVDHARRWAVSQAADVSDAYVFDAALSVLVGGSSTTSSVRGSAAATGERRMRHGTERPARAFELPVTLEEAVRVMHRFARRYANGRGRDAAAAVNTCTRRLLALDLDLGETRLRDGTVWATNGQGVPDDTLTEEQRREAEAALPRRQRRPAP